MHVGRVIGTVWATQKAESLTGMRMLLVRPLTGTGESEEVIVAADPIGAGEGETVLVAHGRAARTVLGSQDCGWQTAVVGIVDSISTLDDGVFELTDDGERSPVA